MVLYLKAIYNHNNFKTKALKNINFSRRYYEWVNYLSGSHCIMYMLLFKFKTIIYYIRYYLLLYARVLQIFEREYWKTAAIDNIIICEASVIIVSFIHIIYNKI